jgi:hypothetical protein
MIGTLVDLYVSLGDRSIEDFKAQSMAFGGHGCRQIFGSPCLHLLLRLQNDSYDRGDPLWLKLS